MITYSAGNNSKSYPIEKNAFKFWDGKKSPEKVLFIRLEAMGDVVITFPYIQGFKKAYPDCEIDFLTKKENFTLPNSFILFSEVFYLQGMRSFKKQLVFASLLSSRLIFKRYDIVFDLQNNEISHLIRFFIFPKSFCSFDRYSPFPAGVRTLNTIQKILTQTITPEFKFDFIHQPENEKLLIGNGWNPTNKLIILNPAGFFETRNWPLENYILFARLWLTKFPDSQFLVLGVNRTLEKAEILKTKLGDAVINLVDKTSPSEAFQIIQKAFFVLSEDSGLMHMSWISGKPTLALFGSSRSDWSRPLGNHSLCLNSSDLECGECMEATCRFGDVHCLTRFSPEFVFEQAQQLLNGVTE